MTTIQKLRLVALGVGWPVRNDRVVINNVEWPLGPEVQCAWNPYESNSDCFNLMAALFKIEHEQAIPWDERSEKMKDAYEELAEAFESGNVPRLRKAITDLAFLRGEEKANERTD